MKTGETVNSILVTSNPGVWMAHCHIAEHLEAGMMLQYKVVPSQESEQEAEKEYGGEDLKYSAF